MSDSYVNEESIEHGLPTLKISSSPSNDVTMTSLYIVTLFEGEDKIFSVANHAQSI